MANDRLFLKCKHCGEEEVLARYLVTEIDVRERSLPFFVRHHIENCSPRMYHGDLGGDSVFDVVTESD